MSCEVHLQEKSVIPELYTVIVKEPYFIFFNKTKIYKDLTAKEVRNLKIPYVKHVMTTDVPYYVYPQNFYL